MLNTYWDKFWKDDNGKVVIMQAPNYPIYIWIVLKVVGHFTSGQVATIFSRLAAATLIAWCLMEIFQGVNYFRRSLGLIILIFTALSLIKSL